MDSYYNQVPWCQILIMDEGFISKPTITDFCVFVLQVNVIISKDVLLEVFLKPGGITKKHVSVIFL